MRELTVEYNLEAIRYGMDVMEDLAHVRAGQKPLVIISQGKCEGAYQAAREIVFEQTATLDHVLCDLVCEDGDMHRHIFICAKGAPYAREARDMILDTIGDVCYRGVNPRKARKSLQMRLGLLLGYSAGEVLTFIDSNIGRTCICDCCGGEETAE